MDLTGRNARRVRKARQRAVAVFATVITAALAVMGTGTAADAVTRAAGYATAATFLGTEYFPGGLGVCIDSGAASPTAAPEPFAVNDPNTAYALTAYVNTTDDATAAALARLVKERYDSNQGKLSTALGQLSASKRAAVEDAYSNEVATANANSGPYSVSPHMHTTGRKTGTITTTGAVSGAGAPMPGYPSTLTLSGPAVFNATGTQVLNYMPDGGTFTAAWTATASGQISATEVVHGLPSNTVWIFPAQSAGYQRVLVTGGPEDVMGQDPVAVGAVVSFQPVGVSHLTSKVAPDGALKDVLSVSAAAGQTWFAGTSVVFHAALYSTGNAVPSAPSVVPAGSTPIGTKDVTASGPGLITAGFSGLAPGGYTVVWSMKKASQPDPSLITADWSDLYAMPDETGVVPFRGSLSSAMSTEVSTSGDDLSLSDALFVSDLPADFGTFSGGSGIGADKTAATNTLWAFPAGVDVLDENLPSARKLCEVPFTLRNGTITTTSADCVARDYMTAFKGVTFAWQVVYPGSDRVGAFTSSVTATSEQYATPPRTLPTVETAAVQLVGDGHPGTRIRDGVTTTGMILKGDTTTISLFRWPTGTTPDCTTPLESWSMPTTLEATSGEYTLDATDMGFDHGFVQVTTGFDDTELSRGVCGEPAETITAAAVTVETAALTVTGAVTGDPGVTRAAREVVPSPAPGPVGGIGTKIQDSLTVVSDTAPIDAMTTFSVYSWPAGTDPVCTTPLASWTVPTAIGATSGVYTFTDADMGKDHGFVQVTKGAGDVVLSEGVCGEPAETIASVPVAISTKAAVVSGSGDVGTTLQDTLTTVSGAVPADAVTTVSLYSWPAGGVPVCTTPLASWTVTTASESTSGIYTYGPQDLGMTHGFVEVTTGFGGKPLTSGTCGEKSETITLPAPLPPVLASTGGGDVRSLGGWVGAILLAGAVVVTIAYRTRDRNETIA